MTKYEFVVVWFEQHPQVKFTNSELEHRLREDYESKHNDEFRDPLREVRKAHERGIVQRTPKGAGQVYWFDPTKE
jgi:hypothetical protein